MPIAEIEMPDGRIAEFDVPDGTTPDEVEQYASENMDNFNTPEADLSVGGDSDARLATYNAINENADENIETIKTSREFNVTPAEAKIASQELRKQKALEMNYKALTAMELINPSQAENLKQSPEKLSIYLQDNETIRNMSTPWKIVQDTAQSFNLGLDAVESADLNGILFFGGTLSPKQEKRLNEINQAQTDKKDYGLGFVGGIPSAVAGTIPQLASSLFSAETATGAAVGAGIGASVGAGVGAAATAPAGGAGALPGAGIGAVGGAVTGAGRGLGVNLLQSQIFSAYSDFRQIKDNNGQNIDDNTARGGAVIAGTIGTALEVVGIKALSKTIPELKALQNAVTRQGLATVLKNPVSRGYLKTIGDIIAGASAEGVTEALQTLTTEATKEFTKLSSGQSIDSFQGGETNDFFGWIADTLEESLKSGAVGIQAGLGFGVTGTGISKIAEKTYKKAQANKEQNHINDMVSLAEKSELNKKDSALFIELTDNPNKKIYTSIKEFNEFFQDKPDIYSDLQARIPEITEQLNQAIETGGDLILPANKVAQAISALNIKEIVPLMRLTPNSLTETDAIAQINDFDYQENYDVGFERKKEIQDNINFQLQNAGIAGIEKDTILKLYSSIYDRAYERTKDSPIAREELNSFIDNQIIRQVSDAEQSGNIDNFDLLIERAKILQNKKGKFKQRPLIGFFEKNGGVKSDSSFAGDILSMGVPRRAVKKDSTFRHDAIPVNEFEDYFNIQGVPDDGSGYVDTNFLSDILNQELSGNDWRENFKGDTPNLEAIKFLDTLNRADIDITTTANKDIKKALIGKQLFQETQNEFDIDDGTPYTEKTIDIKGVTRSAVNSNGQPIAQTKEGLENFWNWFGDSKVVDDKGNPLVVYRSDRTEFEKFDKRKAREGFFFLNKKEMTEIYGGKTRDFYIKIKNPLINKNAIPNQSNATDIKNIEYDGVINESKQVNEFIAVNSTQIKSVFNRGTFDPNDARILYQDDAETGKKDLLVQHNISLDGLLFANKMGGLPIPSIGVSKKGTPLSNFGEITLIADKSLIDPTSKENQIYGADIYSPRYPRVSYQINEKSFDKTLTTFDDFNGFFDKRSKEKLRQNLKDSGINDAKYSPLVQYNYLKTIGKKIDVPIQKEKESIATKSDFSQYIGVNKNELIGSIDFKEKLKKYLQEQASYQEDASNFIKRIKEKNKNEYFENGNLKENTINEYASFLQDYKKDTRIDVFEFEKNLREATENDKDFKSFAKQTFKDVVEKETIESSGKDVSHTIDNVIKVMLKNGLVGTENINYGLPSIRAKFTKKFKSIKDIKENKDLILSKGDFEKVKTEIENDFLNLQKKLQPYEKDGYSDAFQESFFEFSKNKQLEKTFNQHFNGTPDSLKKEYADFVEKLKIMPTEYFEAKITRKVDLSEFKGAIVPKDKVYDEAVKILQKNGIVDIQRYDSDETRFSNIDYFNNLFFQKQGKGKESIKRGSFVLLPNNVSIINLFKDKDKSTILHETGHYLLEMYKALANTPDATKDIINDWNELKLWLKIDSDKVTVDAHETFARGFEAYLMSGKAPSVFLLDIFRTFKRWLVGIYKDVKNLKVNLTPEVKSIFDRMLASEQETEALKNMNIFTPDPEVFKLLTKTEQEDYILRGQKEFQQAEEALLSKKLKELAKKEKLLIQSERDALRQDAEQRIYQSPVHKMRYFFDNGKMPLETQDAIIEDVRIDRQKTIDLYGAEFVNLLPSKYFIKDGVSPDYASDVFGFTDGGQMLNALVNAPKAKDEIQRTVNEDILNRYGDAFNDDTLERDALDMAHEDLREQGILYEYQIIERTGNQRGKKEVLDNTINDFIALSTKDAINTDEYIRRNTENNVRLTGLIEKAKADKDLQSIAKYRAEKIQNQTLITQSKKAREYVNKILAEYKDYAKKQKTNPEDIERSKQIVDAIESKEYLNLSYNDFLNLAYGIQDIRKDYTKKRNEAKQKSRVNPQALKERAIEIIYNMTTNDAMQSDKYYRAEVRAAAEVQKALSKKDYTGAIIAKERQLLNFYLYRQSRDIRNFTNKSLKRFTKYKRTPTAGKVKIDEDYRKQAVALFDMFDFSPRPKSKAGLKAIEEWQKDKQETEGASFLDIDASLFSYDREHYRDIKFSDFYSLVENVESIIAQGRLNRSMEIDGQKHDIAEISEKLTKQVTDNFDTINAPFEPRTQVEKWKRTIKEFFYSTIKARTLLRELDGFKEFGNFYTYFLKPINEASQKMVKRQQKVAEILNGIFDKYYKNRLSGELNKKTFIPEIGQSLSKQAMISYALNYGAVENRQRLLSESNLTEAQLNAVLSQLTKNDYMFIQDVWDFLESFKADIWASEKRRNGIEPQEVQKIGFLVTTKDGESLQLAGGYYPIKYEQEKSSQVAEDSLNDLNNLISNTAQTKRGHTQARLKSVDKPLRNDLGVLFNHVSEVILNLEMGDVLRASYKLLKKKDLSNAIIRAKGRAFFNQLEWWLQDQAIGGSLGSQGMESILGGLRAGVSIATMGLKVSTVLIQPTGILQTAAVIGTKYAFLGMAKTFGNGNPAFIKDAFEFAYKNSKILNQRAETFNRDVNDALRALETGGKIRQKMAQIAFYPMIKVQFIVDVMAWHGAYQKALDTMDGNETKAIEYADDIVGRTQGSGTIQSLSALERGTVGSNTRLSDMVKLFTVYYSYFNTKLNVAYEKTKQTDFKDPSSVLNLATDYLLLFTLEYALGSAILGQLPNDDEDYLSWLMAGTIGNIAGQIPLIREAYSVINGFDGSPSGTRGLKDIGAAGKGVLTATKNAFDEDKDVNIYKLLRDLNMAGGIVFKYPASQMNQTLRAIEKSSDGKDVSPSEYLLYKK